MRRPGCLNALRRRVPFAALLVGTSLCMLFSVIDALTLTRIRGDNEVLTISLRPHSSPHCPSQAQGRRQ